MTNVTQWIGPTVLAVANETLKEPTLERESGEGRTEKFPVHCGYYYIYR